MAVTILTGHARDVKHAAKLKAPEAAGPTGDRSKARRLERHYGRHELRFVHRAKEQLARARTPPRPARHGGLALLDAMNDVRRLVESQQSLWAEMRRSAESVQQHVDEVNRMNRLLRMFGAN
jgi:hypothetical protein